MGELFLVRHGQASFAKSNYDELSHVGFQQAEIVAQHLLNQDVKFDRIYSGSLVRQLNTADAYVNAAREILQLDLPVQVDEGFNEFEAEKVVQHYLPYILQKDEKLQKLLSEQDGFKHHFKKYFFPVMNAWLANEYPSDNVEPWLVFKARVHRALISILGDCEKGESVGVFTSGGAISTIMQIALETPDPVVFQLNYKIANASVSKFYFSDEKLSLSYFNNFTHLQCLNSGSSEGLVTFK